MKLTILLFSLLALGSLHAATTFDFGNGASSANNSTNSGLGNFTAAEGASASQTATIDGIKLDIEAVNTSGGTITLGSNSQGWGVRTSGEGGNTGASRRVGGDTGLEVFEFSFDTDVNIVSFRLGSFGNAAGEVVTLTDGTDTITITRDTSTTSTNPTYDYLVDTDDTAVTIVGSLGTITAGTTLTLSSPTPFGGGVLFNEITVETIPEPTTTLLGGLGLLALLRRRR